ncbi:YHYH domain-containing protein [Comamonadaceae bacterium G21597-S1]|nr:YHYH domain-containing protein [Comamonadaceae bacterium G21597-S1]
MKKLIAALAFLMASGFVLAHSGGTDSNGCHNERRTGGYHCH